MTTKAGHRVIGIRHALKAFKDAGLVDDGHNFPEDAVKDVTVGTLRTAVSFYRIGARRGATEAFDAILRGEFDVEERDDGRVVKANVDSLSWTRGLWVMVGNRRRRVKRRSYRLRIRELGFDD